MTTAFIMCSRKEGDCIPFCDSLSANPGLRGFGELPPRITEIVNAKTMGGGFNNGVAAERLRARDARLSEPDVYVFTHSDVRIWAGRQLWDDMIQKVLTPDTGFVGVAGTDGDLPASGAWWATDGLHGSVAHHQTQQTYMTAFGPYGRARVMDGVFLACSKHTLETIGPWPEDLGWHFYDIWATERAHCLGLKNHVVPLPLLHYSIGEVRGDWKDSRDLYMVKYHPRQSQIPGADNPGASYL